MKKFRFMFNRELLLAVFLFSIPAFLLLSGGCGKKTPPSAEYSGVDTSDIYTLEVIKDRKMKDKYFLENEASPLIPADRETFSGLKYYPPSRKYAFATVLQRLAKPEEIVLATSKDKPRLMLHIGYFPFTLEGKQYRLSVYAPKDSSEGYSWFIPFKDATSGGETYGAGRFIDIDDTRSDSTFLDFNYCYNPYCAYNPRYDCPIPPPENTLGCAIPAGEKILFEHH